MDIEKEIEIIQERNRRVEADKRWEVSWTRKLFIAAVTYGIALWWMTSIGETSAYLKAVVPTGGYLLSTLSLPFVKRWWMGKFRKK
jgi:hypothetical protein